MAHTPGPWRVEEGTTLIWGACNPEDKTSYGMGYPVAKCETPYSWSKANKPSVDEQEVNARLIAAAPDLLEALKKDAARLHRIREKLADWSSMIGTTRADFCNWIYQAECETRAAILKATGEAP
jgi:hypothetical protein